MTALPGARQSLHRRRRTLEAVGGSWRLRIHPRLRPAVMAALIGVPAIVALPPAEAGARPLAASTAQYTSAGITRSRSVAAVILPASFGGVIQAATRVIAPSLPDLSADRIQVVALPANDIVYDRFSGHIWASVPGSAGRAGSSVVPVDPVTGAVGAPV